MVLQQCLMAQFVQGENFSFDFWIKCRHFLQIQQTYKVQAVFDGFDELNGEFQFLNKGGFKFLSDFNSMKPLQLFAMDFQQLLK